MSTDKNPRPAIPAATEQALKAIKAKGKSPLPTRKADKPKVEAGISYGTAGQTYADHLDTDIVGRMSHEMRTATKARWLFIYQVLGTQSPGQAYDAANRYAKKAELADSTWKVSKEAAPKVAAKPAAKSTAKAPKAPASDAPLGSKPAKKAAAEAAAAKAAAEAAA